MGQLGPEGGVLGRYRGWWTADRHKWGNKNGAGADAAGQGKRLVEHRWAGEAWTGAGRVGGEADTRGGGVQTGDGEAGCNIERVRD